MTAGPDIFELPSRNHGPRPEGTAVDLLLLHYTGMRSAEAALERLRDPGAQVSAHYLIDEAGRIYRLVPEDRRAWHAGVSSWAGRHNVNDFSIGIELVNPGHEFGYRPFPGAQMKALSELARGICARHPIPPQRVLGHSDVAPARKQDPGELFDWRWLARQGVGVWPETDTGRSGAGAHVGAARELLVSIGYEVPTHGCMGEAARLTVAAFQRHFLQSKVDGELDAVTCFRIGEVAAAFAR